MKAILTFLMLVIVILLVLNELAQRLVIPARWAWHWDLNPKKTFPVLEVSPTWKTDKIPKIIHQTAPADESQWHPAWIECQKTWKEKFPDYEYKMWTDEDIEELIKTKYEWFWPTYQGYSKKVRKTQDAARCIILYEYGGIYADMDYECIENFMDQIPDGKVSISEDRFIGRWCHGSHYLNALMMGPPKHPFWNYVMANLELFKYGRNPLWSTACHIIEESVRDCPESMFNALSYADYTDGGKWARHLCTATWVQPELREIQRAVYFNA